MPSVLEKRLLCHGLIQCLHQRLSLLILFTKIVYHIFTSLVYHIYFKPMVICTFSSKLITCFRLNVYKCKFYISRKLLFLCLFECILRSPLPSNWRRGLQSLEPMLAHCDWQQHSTEQEQLLCTVHTIHSTCVFHSDLRIDVFKIQLV